VRAKPASFCAPATPTAGFLSGKLKKKMGLHVASTKPKDGLRTYRIISK